MHITGKCVVPHWYVQVRAESLAREKVVEEASILGGDNLS